MKLILISIVCLVLAGCAATQPGPEVVDTAKAAIKAAEAVGGDDVGAGFEISPIDAGDGVRLRDGQDVIVALQIMRMIGEAPAAKIRLVETITLDAEIAEEGGPYAFFHKREQKKLIVKIPPNVRNGQKIRLAGQGHPGKGGGPPGDLFLKVLIRKPLLERLKSLITDR